MADEGPLDALASLFGFNGVSDVTPASGKNNERKGKPDESDEERRDGKRAPSNKPADVARIFKPKSKRGADAPPAAEGKARAKTRKQESDADAADDGDDDADGGDTDGGEDTAE